MDFSLWGGWHVTVFHPWMWVTVGLVVLTVCALVGRLLLLTR